VFRPLRRHISVDQRFYHVASTFYHVAKNLYSLFDSSCGARLRAGGTSVPAASGTPFDPEAVAVTWEEKQPWL
jgi:hypothetical protein